MPWTTVAGDDGSALDMHSAGRAVAAPRYHAALLRLARGMTLEPSNELGAFTLDDGTLYSGATVVATENGGSQGRLSARGGAQDVALELDVHALAHAIAPAWAAGRRGDSYPEFIALRADRRARTTDALGEPSQRRLFG